MKNILSDSVIIPQHIAIIMDGNNRWARKRFLPRIAGHRAATKNLEKIIDRAAYLKVGYLTLFVFSTENWNRPQEEVNALMKLLLKSLKNDTPRMVKNNIRLNVIGCRERLSDELKAAIEMAEDKTSCNTGMTLNLAINYGGIWDITHACKALAKEVENGMIRASDIDYSMIETRLSTVNQPAPDLLIRTSGEHRISNFLIWQCAYSEFFFTDTLWPDFNENELERAIIEYSRRERRFGKTSEQIQKTK